MFRALLLVVAALVGGCASVPATSRHPADPWESYNRSVFEFNERVDRYVLKPVAEGYVAVTPEVIRDGISRFFANLADVRNALNNLLQGRPLEAGSDLLRVVVNTTLGVAGFVDVASEMGLVKHDEDFGQTLGVWGVASGPYFVLPFLGPSTIRDTAGFVADVYIHPVTHIEDDSARWGLRGLYIVDARANLLKAEEVIGGAFYDRYAALRNAYLKRRESLVRNGAGNESTARELLDELKQLDE